MGVATSLLVCCLTCSSVIVKVRHNREGAADSSLGSTPLKLKVETEEFTPDLEKELANIGSGRTDCSICCEPFGGDGNLELVVLQCSHAYHFSCLDAYAVARPNASGSALLCPICQKKAVTRAPPGVVLSSGALEDGDSKNLDKTMLPQRNERNLRRT